MTPHQDIYVEAIEKLGYPGSAAGKIGIATGRYGPASTLVRLRPCVT
jgi:hypothetical protein